MFQNQNASTIDSNVNTKRRPWFGKSESTGRCTEGASSDPTGAQSVGQHDRAMERVEYKHGCHVYDQCYLKTLLR